MATSIPQPFEPQPQAAGLTNPFQDRLLRIDDIARSAELISTVVPLQQLEAASASVPWWHYGFERRSVALRWWLASFPPVICKRRSTMDSPLCWAMEVSNRFARIPTSWSCQADDCLILNGASYSCDTTAVSALLIHLRPERLLSTAMAMGGLQHCPAAWKDLMQQSQCRRLSADATGHRFRPWFARRSAWSISWLMPVRC